jgi:hypothetical protein
MHHLMRQVMDQSGARNFRVEPVVRFENGHLATSEEDTYHISCLIIRRRDQEYRPPRRAFESHHSRMRDHRHPDRVAKGDHLS